MGHNTKTQDVYFCRVSYSLVFSALHDLWSDISHSSAPLETLDGCLLPYEQSQPEINKLGFECGSIDDYILRFDITISYSFRMQMIYSL